ncbi:MAG: c-type cytochrome, partial [Bacteroidota bacterium]
AGCCRAAPDGSLLVADWYDSGVGGHLMGDIERGRIYRLHAKGSEKYTTTPPDLSTPAGAAGALGHVNQATRFLAYQRLVNDPQTEDVLQGLLLDPATASRDCARIAWALAALRGEGRQVIDDLLATDDPLLKETAVRLARQYPGGRHGTLHQAIQAATQSDYPNLWREAALALRYHDNTKFATQTYAELANKYDGQDRWYLEALGIASTAHHDAYFAAWLDTKPDLESVTSRKIVWRSRATAAAELYLRYIQNSNNPEELASFFRALHFHQPEAAKPVLETALFTNDHPKQDEIIRYALGSIKAETLRSSPRIQQRLREVMPSIRGSDVWTMIIDNAELKSEIPALLKASINNPDNDFQDKAAKLIARIGGIDFVKQEFEKRDALGRDRLVHLARHMQDTPTEAWLKELRANEDLPQALRNRATSSLANYWHGMPYLMDLVASGNLSVADAEYTARILTQCWRTDQRTRAIKWLTANRQGEAIDLDAVLDLEGDLARGKEVYMEYCAACHQVGEAGVRYGPNLNKIGDKLGKEALLAAIAYPSQGIGFGYEGYTLEMADGKKLTGYVESQTENELSLRMMGGVTQTVKKNDISQRTPLAESLMTAGLHELMEAQELADLLSYLEELKETEASR